MMVLRGLLVTLGIFLLWALIVTVFHLPPFILPTPWDVLTTWYQQAGLMGIQSIPTIIETVLGFLLGGLAGVCAALIMMYFRPMGKWMMPILLISQALPTFAIAPLLVVWFGYGMTSKIITAMIMLFFPVTSNFYDGLRRTEQQWLNLGRTMGASSWGILWHIRFPAALPALGSGLRIAAAFAPVGAVIGEWVGSSRGLGFLMLNANARMQIDMMFAALFTLVIMTLAFYGIVNKILRMMIPWQREK